MQCRLLLGASLAVVVACGVTACGGGGSTPTSPSASATPPPANTAASQTVTVNIVGTAGQRAYDPNPVRANTGDIVIFRNADSAVHRIVLNDGSADLGEVAPGATSRGFTVGTMNPVGFHCVNHPSMVGSINGAVEEAPCVDAYGQPC